MAPIQTLLLSIKRLWNATVYSWRGLRYACLTQQAFRLEVYLFIIAIPLAVYLETDSIKRLLMLGSIMLIAILELINTAIETTINRIGLEYNELSGIAKDLGSAAVFVAMINAALTWMMILYG